MTLALPQLKETRKAIAKQIGVCLWAVNSRKVMEMRISGESVPLEANIRGWANGLNGHRAEQFDTTDNS